MSEEKDKSLEEKVKELTKAVEALVALEKMKLERETQQQAPPKEEPPVDKELLKEELKEVHLGELVRYAILKDLIPRTTSAAKAETEE